MRAIKKIRKLIAADPMTPTAQTLVRFVNALDSGDHFALSELYELDYDTFGLAVDLLRDWRLHRYFTEKGKLLDLTAQVTDVRH
jgi:hypothetical protein